MSYQNPRRFINAADSCCAITQLTRSFSPQP